MFVIISLLLLAMVFDIPADAAPMFIIDGAVDFYGQCHAFKALY